jgi:hypothetical protein
MLNYEQIRPETIPPTPEEEYIEYKIRAQLYMGSIYLVYIPTA